MKDVDNNSKEQGLPGWMELGRMEFLLRTEIAFWRDLLTNAGHAVPGESVERMQQALALAERRLQQLYEGERGELRSNSRPARTSIDG